MTNTNMISKAKPFLLKPAGKDYLWGESRLNDDFSKGIDLDPLAKTLECSTHPNGPSSVANGEFCGRLLSDVLKTHPEFLGTHPEPKGELPILIKFIDAKKDLSVQIHPDDAYAFEKENGQKGKTELQYVPDASKDAQLIYAFTRDMNPDTSRRSLKTGVIEKYLQKAPIHKDNVFFIKPETVHAIGAGTLIAEIQENSNLTYRMYDYNRTDKNGKIRELHIDKAMDVVKTKGSVAPKQQIRVLRYVPESATELIFRCKYFQVERMMINTERCRELVCFQTDSTSFKCCCVRMDMGGCWKKTGRRCTFSVGTVFLCRRIRR